MWRNCLLAFINSFITALRKPQVFTDSLLSAVSGPASLALRPGHRGDALTLPLLHLSLRCLGVGTGDSLRA